MSTVETRVPPLSAGDNLTRSEFLRRWEASPEIKRAELIGGIVFMPSPLKRPHAVMDSRVGHWLSHYELHTPGCESASNATWLMQEETPQVGQ